MKCWWIFFHKYSKWESVHWNGTIIEQIKVCSKCNKAIRRYL